MKTTSPISVPISVGPITVNTHPNREVVHIAGDAKLHALCRDGTIWSLDVTGKWLLVAPIPAV